MCRRPHSQGSVEAMDTSKPGEEATCPVKDEPEPPQKRTNPGTAKPRQQE